jgi:CBS domain-containing protein
MIANQISIETLARAASLHHSLNVEKLRLDQLKGPNTTKSRRAAPEDTFMNVASILKTKGRAVSTVRPNATLLDVTKKLGPKKIGAIVVVGENGHVAGIISERDIIRAISERGAPALSLMVSEVMTRNVVSCQETSELDELMEMMTKGRFRHLPVVEDDALVGIISIGDVVKFHVAEVEMEVSAMRNYLATG